MIYVYVITKVLGVMKGRCYPFRVHKGVCSGAGNGRPLTAGEESFSFN